VASQFAGLGFVNNTKRMMVTAGQKLNIVIVLGGRSTSMAMQGADGHTHYNTNLPTTAVLADIKDRNPDYPDPTALYLSPKSVGE
jgi:hypothetical protein